MLSDRDAFTSIRCSELSAHITCEQDPGGRTAATNKVLQVGSSLLRSVVRGQNFPDDQWWPIVPTSGLEGRCCWVFFRGSWAEQEQVDLLIHLGAQCLTRPLAESYYSPICDQPGWGTQDSQHRDWGSGPSGSWPSGQASSEQGILWSMRAFLQAILFMAQRLRNPARLVPEPSPETVAPEARSATLAPNMRGSRYSSHGDDGIVGRPAAQREPSVDRDTHHVTCQRPRTSLFHQEWLPPLLLQRPLQAWLQV